jgi:hypothetical protein
MAFLIVIAHAWDGENEHWPPAIHHIERPV